LKPELVSTDTDAKLQGQAKDIFKYDHREAKNPDPLPKLFQVCQRRFWGLCQRDPLFTGASVGAANFSITMKSKTDYKSLPSFVSLEVDGLPESLSFFAVGKFVGKHDTAILVEFVRRDARAADSPTVPRASSSNVAHRCSSEVVVGHKR
jgi:hypothetical protein